MEEALEIIASQMRWFSHGLMPVASIELGLGVYLTALGCPFRGLCKLIFHQDLLHRRRRRILPSFQRRDVSPFACGAGADLADFALERLGAVSLRFLLTMRDSEVRYDLGFVVFDSGSRGRSEARGITNEVVACSTGRVL